MYSDFVMIVADLCNIKLEEIVIQKNSDQEKKLFKNPTLLNTFPILEIDENTFLTDSYSISAYLARKSNMLYLLGGSSDFEQSQVD